MTWYEIRCPRCGLTNYYSTTMVSVTHGRKNRGMARTREFNRFFRNLRCYDCDARMTDAQAPRASLNHLLWHPVHFTPDGMEALTEYLLTHDDDDRTRVCQDLSELTHERGVKLVDKKLVQEVIWSPKIYPPEVVECKLNTS